MAKVKVKVKRSESFDWHAAWIDDLVNKHEGEQAEAE